MSFLRVQRGIVRRNQRNTVQVDAAWVADGKKFATKKKAGEYLWRKLTDTLACDEGGGTCGLARNYFECERGKTPEKPGRIIASEAGYSGDTSLVDRQPKKFRSAPGGLVRRVYLHGLLWRVTVEDRWVSDHASMDDALAGSNPIGIEPGKIEGGVVVIPQ